MCSGDDLRTRVAPTWWSSRLLTCMATLMLLAACTSGDGPSKKSGTPKLNATSEAVARTGALAIGSRQRVSVAAATFSGGEDSAARTGWGSAATVFVGRPVTITTA